MDISLVVAKVLGVYLIVSGLAMILRGKTVPHLLKDFFDHPAIVYLTGVILIFLSTLVLIQQNVWDGSWRTLVTVLSWLTLIKGLCYILVPEMLEKLVSKKIYKSLSLFGFIAIVAGLALFYAAGDPSVWINFN